ncbi:MAG: DUF3750 domain-containing protein [Proteobacteria bacterium]|nr:DUF3750 domain-containing protein [Pseudomonadota bacterium]
MKRVLKYFGMALAVLLALGLMRVGQAQMAVDWRTASREPAGLAPDPMVVRDAVVQVYAARAWGWKGHFGVHTWIAAKRTNASAYTVYEVIGWRTYRGLSAVAIGARAPDTRWFGNLPVVVADQRSPGVDGMIDRIEAAAGSYPFANSYQVWPGPNSNTFVAHVARAVPELRVDLPPTAIGKDFLTNGNIIAKTPSGTGVRVSLFGLLGVMVGVEEGIEINILGLTFGIDPLDLAIKLPLVGRLGGEPG